MKKPLLGVMPEIIWLEKRIDELAKAIYQYTKIGDYNTSHKWAWELHRRYKDRMIFYKENPDIIEDD